MTPVAYEGSPESSFLFGAKFPKRAVPAAVLYRRARLEPLGAEVPNCKVDRHPRALLKHAGSPEHRPDRKAPFDAREPDVVRSDLYQPDGDVPAFRNDAEAHVAPLGLLPARPRDEALELRHRLRRRRNEKQQVLCCMTTVTSKTR